MVGNKTKEDDYSADSEVEYDYDESQDIVDDETELYEIQSDAVVQVVLPGNVIPLFSPPSALELFYLSKVIRAGKIRHTLVPCACHAPKLA